MTCDSYKLKSAWPQLNAEEILHNDYSKDYLCDGTTSLTLDFPDSL